MSVMNKLSIAYFRSLKIRHYLGIVGAVALLLLPYVAGPLFLFDFTRALYFAVFVMSWDIMSGYTGELSFGHSFIFAVGGYSAAIMTLDFGLAPAMSILVGIVFAVVAGLIIGAASLRLSGPYFSILTFLLPTVLTQVFILYSGTFGGTLGLSSPESLVTLDGQIPTIVANYYLATIFFLAVLVVLYLITRSDIGTILTSIRENESVVSAAGLNPTKYKMFAFVLSAIVGGLAGALLVHSPAGSPTPSVLLDVTVSINVLLAAILGGMGTIVGAAIGGLLFFMLRNVISASTLSVAGLPVSQLDLVIFSTIILVLIYLLPQGVVPWLLEQGGRLVPGRDHEPATDGGTTPLMSTLRRYRESLSEVFDDE